MQSTCLLHISYLPETPLLPSFLSSFKNHVNKIAEEFDPLFGVSPSDNEDRTLRSTRDFARFPKR